MVIVDTNVLVDVLEDDPQWVDWSIARMRELSKVHELAINPVIYAELSLTFDTFEDLDAAVSDLDLKFVEIPRPALFLAGKAYIRYRRQGGTQRPGASRTDIKAVEVLTFTRAIKSLFA